MELGYVEILLRTKINENDLVFIKSVQGNHVGVEGSPLYGSGTVQDTRSQVVHMWL